MLYMQVKYIDKFDLDSLTTEEVFILDCKGEIYVWVGQEAGSRMDMNILTVAKVLLNNFPVVA